MSRRNCRCDYTTQELRHQDQKPAESRISFGGGWKEKVIGTSSGGEGGHPTRDMFPSPHWLRPGRLTRSAGQTSQAPWASIQGVLMVTSLLSHPSGLQWLHFPNFSVSTRYSHRHQSSCCLAGDDLAAVLQISIDWQVVSCVWGQTKQRRSTPVLSLQVPSPPFLTAVPL
ncbi:unnamed protein product [Larinioides sclopetarius]|uniref:Uncharacterized protein n=1 Tax=Larinioides sclopetarius TaxID=280406 RepID=A0AAV1ZVY6_9ARAC